MAATKSSKNTQDEESEATTRKRSKRIANNGTKKNKSAPKIFTPFKCDECHKEFADKYLLQAHEKLHSAERPFSCPDCPYTCKVRKYLSRHVKKVHSAPTGHKCPECGKMFHFRCNLENHLRVHTGEKPNKCKVCGKAFNSSYSLSTHMYIHTDEKPFQCSFCEYACRDSSTLRKHQERHMGLERVYQCKLCETRCKSKWQLKMHVAEKHLKVDVRHHACPRCPERFKTRSQLSVHVKAVHERLYAAKCEVCDVIVSNRHNMAAHMRRHVTARPYRCTHAGCHNTYKDSSSLRKHAVTHAPQRQPACEVCGRRFARPERLRRHLRTHAPRRKRVQCHHCGDRFYSKNYLCRHIERKHSRKRRRFICDMCDFGTTNKPSLVMHIKYGHLAGNKVECDICNKLYKTEINLKQHYSRQHAADDPQTAIKKQPITIKEEPMDEHIDLLEVCKEEIIDVPEPKSPPEPPAEAEGEGLTEATARHMIRDHSDRLGKLPEAVFDHFYIDAVVKRTRGRRVKREHIDEQTAKHAKRCVDELLTKVRRHDELEALERTRRQYNRRMSEAVRAASHTPNIKIKYFNKTNTVTDTSKSDDDVQNDDVDSHNNDVDSQSNDVDSQNDDVDKESNDVDSQNDDNANDEKSEKDSDNVKIDRSRRCKNNNKTYNDVIDEGDNEIIDDDDDKDELFEDVPKKKSTKFKLNSHQCYICFKLFPTKSSLLDHCKDHFDICNNVTLKKCPLCEHVVKSGLKKHMKDKHDLNINVLYSQINDEKDNSTGSRYSYKVRKNKAIEKIEIIPSVKNLNKHASKKIDDKNREMKTKCVAKTKLVKKGNEWIVEEHRVGLKDNYALPKISRKDIGKVKSPSKSYVDRMKKLYQIAKKKGHKMLFPCEDCEKICQTVAALKLHTRKHDPNKKPFAPKIWKHKTKDIVVKEKKKVVLNTANRLAKPKPIVNKHKCDPKLKDFYENNIKGGDIEFWQFLKIYNRMGRNNVKDFKDLENTTEFGIHTMAQKPKKVVKRKVIGRTGLSREENLKRDTIKRRLREKISKQ